MDDFVPELEQKRYPKQNDAGEYQYSCCRVSTVIQKLEGNYRSCALSLILSPENHHRLTAGLWQMCGNSDNDKNQEKKFKNQTAIRDVSAFIGLVQVQIAKKIAT